MLLRLSRSSPACRVSGRTWTRSIIALRSSQAGFAERAGQKILLQRQLPELCVQQLQIDRGCRLASSRARAEDTGRPLLKLRFPRRDLVPKNVRCHMPQR